MLRSAHSGGNPAVGAVFTKPIDKAAGKPYINIAMARSKTPRFPHGNEHSRRPEKNIAARAPSAVSRVLAETDGCRPRETAALNILAVDTAADVLAVALGTEGGTFSFEADAGLRHSELLMDAVSALVRLAGLEPDSLDYLACMKGPGSFTGLRIGFAALKGIATALGIPAVSVPTLDIMAYPHRAWPGPVVPLIDARRNRCFSAVYQAGERRTGYLDESLDAIIQRVEETAAVNAGDCAAALFTGPGAEKVFLALPETWKSAHPVILDSDSKKGRARDLLNFLSQKDMLWFEDEASVFSPLYIRASDAERETGG